MSDRSDAQPAAVRERTDPAAPPSASVYSRFPAIGALVSGRSRRRMPVIQTLAMTDCGAAALAMVLAYHGKSVRLEELRDSTGTNRDGVDAWSLIQAGQLYGLRGRGVRVEIDELRHLGPPAILHWAFNHFVVLERVSGRSADIVDPAFGRRRVTLEELGEHFTGVALTFEPGEGFTPSEERSAGVWRYFRRVLGQPGIIARIVVVSLLIQAFLLATPVVTSALVDRVIPREDYPLLGVLGVGVVGIVLFHFLSLLLRSHLLLHLRTHLDVQMTLGFLEHLVGLPFAFFQRRSTGDLMMRLSSNATMRELLTSTTMSALLDGSLVSLYLVLLFAIHPRMGLVVVGLGVLKVLIFLFSRRVYRALMTKDLAAQARSEGYLVELLSGIETLKSLGAEQRAVEHWSNLFVDQLNIALQRGRTSALVDSLMAALQTASPLIILTYGVTQVLEGRLSLGSMLGLTALGTGFLTPLSALVAGALSLQLLKSYVDRIDDVLSHPPEQAPDTAVPAGKLGGAITLEHVWFSYGKLAAPAIKDVSLQIAAGASVAIVGPSGAGKSTLARLLIALHAPTQGRVLFDGVDLAALDVRSVRRQMGIVPQEPYLFNASIRENILLGQPSLPLEAATNAARLANIDQEITAMPMGYNTLIGDAGSALSAGQRQRLALARALVHRPAILLLDEATSALDTVNERIIQENLARFECTRLVIAHRLSTVIQADLIVVLEQGEVVESGTHESLVKRGGRYAKLIAAQLQSDEAMR